MTITYQKNVSNTSFMGFAKLLFKWKGSIYKLVFKELLMYGAAFGIISICYRYYMSDPQRRQFEKVSLYCNETAGLMPMSFVLGFYVTFVVSRWWNQFLNLPWPDRMSHTILMYVRGVDERSRIIRRTLVRYILLATALLFQTISGSVKKRFPTTAHLVHAGLMTSEERQMYEGIELNLNKHFIPFVWSINLINVALTEGRVDAGMPLHHLLEEINNLRTKTGHLWGHNWVTVPLVYTQVVTLLTHLFFMTCLVGRQFLDPSQGYSGHDIDLYFPVYTFLQFFFFLGWLKVAEQLINPFGEDDDDFETNWFIDRNMQVCYAIVDEMYGKVAQLEKDVHWGKMAFEVPYTEEALIHKVPTYKGSTMDVIVPAMEQTVVYHDFGNVLLEGGNSSTRFGNVLSRICCGFCNDKHPQMNKPLGESYGKMEPFNADNQYDNPEHRKVSNYSIFGESYFNIMNNRRCSRNNSTCTDVVPQDVAQHSGWGVKRGSTVSESGLLSPNEPNGHLRQVSNKRHRPSVITAQVLTSVSETEKEEENESQPPSPTDTLKLALAFLDDDLEDIVTVIK